MTIVRFDEDKKKIFEQGNIVDYLTKPFDIDELTERIHKHIKQQ